MLIIKENNMIIDNGYIILSPEDIIKRFPEFSGVDTEIIEAMIEEQPEFYITNRLGEIKGVDTQKQVIMLKYAVAHLLQVRLNNIAQQGEGGTSASSLNVKMAKQDEVIVERDLKKSDIENDLLQTQYGERLLLLISKIGFILMPPNSIEYYERVDY
jgi:hypothetical protein